MEGWGDKKSSYWIFSVGQTNHVHKTKEGREPLRVSNNMAIKENRNYYYNMDDTGCSFTPSSTLREQWL